MKLVGGKAKKMLADYRNRIFKKIAICTMYKFIICIGKIFCLIKGSFISFNMRENKKCVFLSHTLKMLKLSF